MKQQVLMIFFLLVVGKSRCSFWTDIPARCTYDRTVLFSCWNTTFIQPIPLFNDLKYTLQNHNVQIRDSIFQLSLNDLFSYVGANIEYLTLINNTFSSMVFNKSEKIYFRLLQYLQIQDNKGLQWFQLNTSYYPQLLKLDLSYNQLTTKNQLLFNQQSFPILKYLNLSHNQLQSMDNITGTILSRIEVLVLSYNPLETVINKINEFQSLSFLDLSSTSIKQLFSLRLLPRLETFLCRQCRQIPMNDYDKFLVNCSQVTNQLILDLTGTNITSVNFLHPCIKDLTLNNQYSLDSISTKDFLFNTNLENIQLRNITKIDYIHLNVYDRLQSIDFSDNPSLRQVQLRLMSNYTYLQRLLISRTSMKDFSIDFNKTKDKFLHVDVIDMSYGRLETLDFLQHITFYTLDVSYNRLKLIDISHIHFRHGMYESSLMNSLNLSSNQMESIQINWDNESPHTIDLSQNNLQSIKLHGQTTYTLLLSNNTNLSLTPTAFNLQLPFLQYLDLNTINLQSLEHLIYLHNLSNIHTLILDNNQLDEQHRTLNWNIFYPWHGNLTHVSLRNICLEKIDPGVYLNDYYHLLTINFYGNDRLPCDCVLLPFITWLKTPPPPLADFYEPLKKVLSVDCPISLFDLRCDDRKTISTLSVVLLISGITLIVVLITLPLLVYYRKRKRSKSHHSMLIESDLLALDERDAFETPEDE